MDVRARHSGFCMSIGVCVCVRDVRGVRCEGCTCVHGGLSRIKGNEMVDWNGERLFPGVHIKTEEYVLKI